MHGGVNHLHDLCLVAVGVLGEDLEALQAVGGDHAGLHLGAAAVCVELPADGGHAFPPRE